jgi:uncharacterized protein YjbI with pentapeptide repeats
MTMDCAMDPAIPSGSPGNDGEALCAVWMNYFDAGLKCGRPLHNAPAGADSVPVCLMHSNDPGKQSGPLFVEFWRQFEIILGDSGVGPAHCERFVFPRVDLRGRTINAFCQFVKATFTQEADLSGATFTQDPQFSGATFVKRAVFSKTNFPKGATFSSATFTDVADFREANFDGTGYFLLTTFVQDGYFRETNFNRDVLFLGANFTMTADFYKAVFTGDSSFTGANFMKKANFVETTFLQTSTWRGAQFLEDAEFRRTKFSPAIAGQPGAIFALAAFAKPGSIIFDDVDLSRALFHNCLVSEVWFTSSVRWGTRHRDRRGNLGAMVFEEVIALDQEYGKDLQRDGERDYRAIAQIYQQLKKNYDARLDYWTGNEFHFGEMEMQRLSRTPKGRLSRARRWAYRHFSLVALYRWASDYGNSYWKPMIWLLGVIVLFAALYPLPYVGLEHGAPHYTETYASVWTWAGSSVGHRMFHEVGLFLKSALAALDTATFQKSPEYSPAYPWGRSLAIAETLLTSTLFALFLLAIRRQFRR